MDTVAGHTVVVDIVVARMVAVVDIVADHRLAAVAGIVVARMVAVVVGIVVARTVVVAVNSRVAHTGMDMAVVLDTVEKIAQVAYSQSGQVALEWLG